MSKRKEKKGEIIVFKREEKLSPRIYIELAIIKLFFSFFSIFWTLRLLLNSQFGHSEIVILTKSSFQTRIQTKLSSKDFGKTYILYM